MAYDNELWEQIFKDNEWGKYPAIPVVRFIARNFYKAADRKAIKILEIGSGTGANLWFCAKEGFSVYCIEGSQVAVDRMINRFNDEGLSERIKKSVVGDYLTKLDAFEDDYFDAIIDYASLCCNPIDYTSSVVEKCFKKLVKGGSMLSVTFSDGTWGLSEESAGYHACYPIVGPLNGKGFNRYTTRDDINKIYSLGNNKIERVERQEYFYSDSEVMKEWVIELRKI